MYLSFCLHCEFERESHPVSTKECEDDGGGRTRRAVLRWYAVPASSLLKIP